MMYIYIYDLFCYFTDIYILNPRSLPAPFVDEIYFSKPI